LFLRFSLAYRWIRFSPQLDQAWQTKNNLGFKNEQYTDKIFSLTALLPTTDILSAAPVF
jgi:hypothetical protein